MKKKKISELEPGNIIQFGRINKEPINWLVGEKDHEGFPSGSVTIVTHRTLGNITFGLTNPLEKEPYRRLYGSNRYRDSYVRKYMNSKEFLNTAFTKKEREAIVVTSVSTKTPDIDGDDFETCLDRLFLLSAIEVGLEGENGSESIIELFKKEVFCHALDINGDPDWWWLRTPYASNSCLVRHVNTSGTLNSYLAYNGNLGFRPACNLESDYLVSVLC